MERNRAAICMIDKKFLAICNFYIVFITFYLTAFCEIFCTAISMVDEKETRAICNFYTVFTTFYFTVFCETFCTATSMIGEEEIFAICYIYTVFVIFCETVCSATNIIDEKETRAICSFYTVFAIFYFIISYEIFTTDQQLIKYRINDRYISIIIDIKFVFISG
jgi:hypothetical protein